MQVQYKNLVGSTILGAVTGVALHGARFSPQMALTATVTAVALYIFTTYIIPAAMNAYKSGKEWVVKVNAAIQQMEQGKVAVTTGSGKPGITEQDVKKLIEEEIKGVTSKIDSLSSKTSLTGEDVKKLIGGSDVIKKLAGQVDTLEKAKLQQPSVTKDNLGQLVLGIQEIKSLLARVTALDQKMSNVTIENVTGLEARLKGIEQGVKEAKAPARVGGITVNHYHPNAEDTEFNYFQGEINRLQDELAKAATLPTVISQSGQQQSTTSPSANTTQTPSGVTEQQFRQMMTTLSELQKAIQVKGKSVNLSDLDTRITDLATRLNTLTEQYTKTKNFISAHFGADTEKAQAAAAVVAQRKNAKN